MANVSGPQPHIVHCPICKSDLRNIPREEMTSQGYHRADGTVSRDTHTYQCTSPGCGVRFEINQQQ